MKKKMIKICAISGGSLLILVLILVGLRVLIQSQKNDDTVYTVKTETY